MKKKSKRLPARHLSNLLRKDKRSLTRNIATTGKFPFVMAVFDCEQTAARTDWLESVGGADDTYSKKTADCRRWGIVVWSLAILFFSFSFLHDCPLRLVYKRSHLLTPCRATRLGLPLCRLLLCKSCLSCVKLSIKSCDESIFNKLQRKGFFKSRHVLWQGIRKSY